VPAAQVGRPLSDICACPRLGARRRKRGWCGCHVRASGRLGRINAQEDPDEILGMNGEAMAHDTTQQQQRIHSRMVAGFHVSVCKYCHLLSIAIKVQGATQFRINSCVTPFSSQSTPRKIFFPETRSISPGLPTLARIVFWIRNFDADLLSMLPSQLIIFHRHPSPQPTYHTSRKHGQIGPSRCVLHPRPVIGST
jgi:hypothetical protein